MLPVFELPHIFVIFQPGAGGNFISGLLTKIISNDLGFLPVSSSGSSHTTIDKKIAGVDYMSFGTITEDRSEFPTEEDRINFYLDNIRKHYGDVKSPQVVWTHDFLNIPIYKNFFPNSKILIVTQDTHREKLIVMAQSITKNLMDPDSNSPLTDSQWAKLDITWKAGARLELNRIFSDNYDLVEHIIKNRFRYKNLMTYVLFKKLLNFNGMLPYLGERTEGNWGDLSNNILSYNFNHTSDQSSPIHIIGPEYKWLYGLVPAVLFPYKCIIDNDVDAAINLFGAVLDRTLDTEQQDFVTENFNNYKNGQNQDIFTDVINYYQQLKQLAAAETSVIQQGLPSSQLSLFMPDHS